MYDFENYINELNVPQKHIKFGIYLNLIVGPKCWGILKNWSAPSDSSKKLSRNNLGKMTMLVAILNRILQLNQIDIALPREPNPNFLVNLTWRAVKGCVTKI